MELLDFVQMIGGHITFQGGIGSGEDGLRVEISQDFRDLSYRPYPGGSGSIGGWAKIGKDLNEAYEAALADLVETMNDLDCRQVGFDVQPLWTLPELTHTKGYRPKAKRKVKS